MALMGKKWILDFSAVWVGLESMAGEGFIDDGSCSEGYRSSVLGLD